MIQKWPLMHASRRVTEKPLKETQAEVLVTKEGDNTQGSDLGINCARVLQEVLPQLNNGGVISHLLFQSKGSQLALRKKSKGGLVIARQRFGFLRQRFLAAPKPSGPKAVIGRRQSALARGRA